jgi:hypothetical protein
MSNGWAVNVKAAAAGEAEAASSETYYVRVSDRHAAEDHLRQILGASRAVIVEARLPVQSTVFDTINVEVGQVRVRPTK